MVVSGDVEVSRLGIKHSLLRAFSKIFQGWRIDLKSSILHLRILLQIVPHELLRLELLSRSYSDTNMVFQRFVGYNFCSISHAASVFPSSA